MKLFKKLRKGFTLIELVVVIAVIAILSAVAVVSYIAITRSAHESNDHLMIDQINSSVLGSSIIKKSATVHDVIEKLDETEGFGVERLKPELEGTEFVYSYSMQKFGYLKDGKVAYPSDVAEKFSTLPREDFWRFVDPVASFDPSDAFSHYLKGEDSITSVSTSAGLDVGKVSVSSINYGNSGSGKNVVIRTNSFATKVTVNAPKDVVKHYGNAAVVNVEATAGKSYHENGTVGRLIVQEGHAVAEQNSVVFCFVDAGVGTTATAEVKSGASVYDASGNSNGQAAVLESAHDDCGAGHHTYGSQLVIDNYIYEVCKSCGYTLITVQDSSGNEVKQTKNVLDTEGNVVSENITPIETYLVSEVVNSDPSEEVVKNYEISGDPIVETPKVEKETMEEGCSHTFDDGQITLEPTCTATGTKTYTCTKCNSTYSITVAKKAHDYWDKAGFAHTSDETCSVCGHVRGENVAQIGETKYHTLTDALEAVPANGVATKITLINDDSIEGNIGWVIPETKCVVLDLNGYRLKGLITSASGSVTINNLGNLVVMDSSDTFKNGTGTGRITNEAKDGVQLGAWPSYNWANNIITNKGNLTIEGGYIKLDSPSGIAYCVDTFGQFSFKGGKLECIHGDQAVRIACYNAGGAALNMTGGIIQDGGIWIDQPQNNKQIPGHINVSGGIINGFIDLASCKGNPSSVDPTKVTVNFTGSAVINATKLRIRSGSENANYCFVNIDCASFTCSEGFDSDNIIDENVLGGLISISSTTNTSQNLDFLKN